LKFRGKITSDKIMEVFLMAHVIGNECVSCGACESECPVGCISAGDGKYVIDENQCIDCGSCASVCPMGAIKQA
jgi:ferredoxin